MIEENIAKAKPATGHIAIWKPFTKREFQQR
jgi:hypothetical protein